MQFKEYGGEERSKRKLVMEVRCSRLYTLKSTFLGDDHALILLTGDLFEVKTKELEAIALELLVTAA